MSVLKDFQDVFARRRYHSYQPLSVDETDCSQSVKTNMFDKWTVAERVKKGHLHLDRNEVQLGWLMIGSAIAEDQWAVLSECDAAVERSPCDGQVYLKRGRIMMHIGKYEHAAQDFTRCIELDPTNVRAYNNRGNAYHRLKRHQIAIENYNAALEINPNFASAFLNRGLTYAASMNTESAIQDFTRAIELEPNNVKAYWNRYLLYKKLGQRSLASKDRKMAQMYSNTVKYNT